MPARDRSCDDRLAEPVLDRWQQRVLAIGPLRAAIPKLIERLFAGPHYYVLARTRYFDDVLADAQTAAVRQLVILGAGFDSRAYRFADRLRDVRVFEVDHPATSAVKRGTLEAILGAVPATVALVAVDFQRGPHADRLAAADDRGDQRSIFLWEGTAPHLAAAAVDATLRFIATRSPPGSRVIFDCLIAGVLDGTCAPRGAATERAQMLRTPEPFVFGIAAANIPRFLTARGCPACRRAADVEPWSRIIHATG